MASIKKPDESTLTAAMRLVTAMMKDHDALHAHFSGSDLEDQIEPIDCDALRDMLNTGQNLLIKYCPALP